MTKHLLIFFTFFVIEIMVFYLLGESDKKIFGKQLLWQNFPMQKMARKNNCSFPTAILKIIAVFHIDILINVGILDFWSSGVYPRECWRNDCRCCGMGGPLGLRNTNLDGRVEKLHWVQNDVCWFSADPQAVSAK